MLSPLLLAFGYERENVVVSLLVVEFSTSVLSGMLC